MKATFEVPVEFALYLVEYVIAAVATVGALIASGNMREATETRRFMLESHGDDVKRIAVARMLARRAHLTLAVYVMFVIVGLILIYSGTPPVTLSAATLRIAVLFGIGALALNEVWDVRDRNAVHLTRAMRTGEL